MPINNKVATNGVAKLNNTFCAHLRSDLNSNEVIGFILGEHNTIIHIAHLLAAIKEDDTFNSTYFKDAINYLCDTILHNKELAHKYDAINEASQIAKFSNDPIGDIGKDLTKLAKDFDLLVSMLAKELNLPILEDLLLTK